MSQRPTQHPPTLAACQLSWEEQLLARLDEIVGLLDGIGSQLDGLLDIAGDLSHAGLVSDERDEFLDLLMLSGEEDGP